MGLFGFRSAHTHTNQARYMPHDLQPKTRFVISAREPVARLLSFFNAFGANGASFVELVDTELKR